VGLILIFRIRITRFNGVSPFPVPSAAKDLHDAKEVVGQFLLWGHFDGVKDCDSDTIDGKDMFDEFKGKSAKTVPCGHDDFVDISFVSKFQNGFKALAFPVDSTGNVGDDDMVGIFNSQESDLAIEVIPLFPRGHSGVDDSIFRFRDGSWFLEHFGDFVSALPPWRPKGFDFPGVSPSSEGGIGDSEEFFDFGSADIFFIHQLCLYLTMFDSFKLLCLSI
jgi:hypothetical protein